MSPAVKAAVIPIGHQNPMMDVFDRECKQLGGMTLCATSEKQHGTGVPPDTFLNTGF